jgi:polyketide biosynthesis 3-hydroxy-3-methylglutaryl-CoA synthase-like enzyme PksG
MRVGIEAINFYGGAASIDVTSIFQMRQLDLSRFDNLMMSKKSVGLPCEDAVTHGVNAAIPLINALTPEEKNRIELVITSSESGLDFGKSLSTYIHDYLGLSRSCRLFEIKQACYGGTAAFHMASTFVASNVSPGAKALVIASDVARAAARLTYAETSQGLGAIAMLISNKPDVFELDFGATGQYSYEVMDTCRPKPDIETGDADLSLLSYLDCLENSYKAYCEKVEDVDFVKTFDYMAYHTPFAGIVKGGHRKMMRELVKISPKEIDADFERRIGPSMLFCTQVGNVYSATVYLALCGLIESARIDSMKRIGIFSYGSGCSSEFYSGVVTPKSKEVLKAMNLQRNLDGRYKLSSEEYEDLFEMNMAWPFGIKDKEMDLNPFRRIYDHFIDGRHLLVLKRVNNYHREYEWS